MIRSTLLCALCFTSFSAAERDFYLRDPDTVKALACRRHEDRCFLNWYKSINVGGPIEAREAPNNTDSTDFTSGLAAIQNIVDEAFDNGLRIRAHGSKWSLSNAAYTNDVMMNSQGLTYCKVGIDDTDHVTPEYQNIRDRLVIVQSGVMVRDLHQILKNNSLALPTTVAAGGERLVGAVSTGAHGSAQAYGAMQEVVRAIHIVIPSGHFLLQRATDPVITEDFGLWLDGASVISDDTLFNAALVSFGSFGIIHAVVIETEPLYGLKLQSKQFSYDKVRPVLESLNPSSLGFDGIGTELPFHFEVSFNPYKRDKDGCFVRLFEKVELPEEDLSIQQESELLETYRPTNLFEALDQTITTSMALLPTTILKKIVFGRGVQIVLQNVFRTTSPGDQGQVRKPYEWFNYEGAKYASSEAPIAGTSIEIGVPADRVVEAIEIIFKIVDRDPVAAPVAVRLVKKSGAMLAFTKYDLTATIEMPGPCDRILFRHRLKTMQKIFKAFAASDIPHTYHWGQQLPLNEVWVPKAFGEDVVETWKQTRADFLGDAVDTFSNEMMEDLGLYP
ncbi:hypothetical protein FisN_5Lh428 [Fistulifera solaris]|uniref:FAD-binding PCMH-type domain-containing protein n=1 Tax=Fistulifera solaris TaxID=1519565 RepID=A0A1Z5KGU6_FISSO|nr:hypothetical protein FisN_5Lh428 [Fistulifera solaris]|eukprot:GAX25335.1 hypothetical protein FisN_5Lh428 [Fistulifera solaris]